MPGRTKGSNGEYNDNGQNNWVSKPRFLNSKLFFAEGKSYKYIQQLENSGKSRDIEILSNDYLTKHLCHKRIGRFLHIICNKVICCQFVNTICNMYNVMENNY